MERALPGNLGSDGDSAAFRARPAVPQEESGGHMVRPRSPVPDGTEDSDLRSGGAWP